MKVTHAGRQITVNVTADGDGLVSHAGSALLGQVADKTGVTRALEFAVGEPGLRAGSRKLGYREFLDLVLESEVGVLEGRRYASRLKLSGLPHHKTLDDIVRELRQADQLGTLRNKLAPTNARTC